ncbi:zinc finger SWIM domain-containing protein 7 isoform 1-T1 [Dama dama]|uniref:zinc finger SWIM domain-containing protein 7 isoform X1 n=1 Tax=Dama dama TaxID=30532 RepID=UPI002A37147E|nr:zinc finger SWIM domain-containing protein 7 isoform X1 [Dama dama]
MAARASSAHCGHGLRKFLPWRRKPADWPGRQHAPGRKLRHLSPFRRPGERGTCHGGSDWASHAASRGGGAAERDGGGVPDEHLLSLKFVFGSSAVQALDLVDRQSVTLISSPSGRRVYQVLGSSGRTYTCLASCHYCSCPAFAFSVLRKGDSLVCKHLLAVYLSQVTRTCQQLSVSDKQLTDILSAEKTQEA